MQELMRFIIGKEGFPRFATVPGVNDHRDMNCHITHQCE
jgi:hypothetical protein